MRPDLSKHCVDDFRITLDRTAILASELIQLYLYPCTFHLRKCTRRRHPLSRTFLAACVFIISSTVLILFTNAYLHHHMAFIVMTSGVVLFALRLVFNSHRRALAANDIQQQCQLQDSPIDLPKVMSL